MNEGGDFAGQKRELRKRMLAARRALTEAERAAYSAKITEKLLSHSAVTQAQKIFAYAAMQDEDFDKLIADG